MRTQNGKENGIETERIKMWINRNKKLNSNEKTKVKTVFFYHNVLIAMQKEFHCPYVGTHKLCGTFEKGPHQPCANGQNNSVFCHLIFDFIRFCFSCRIFEMSNTSLNTSNTLNSSAKARSARSVDARSHTLSSFNWIFFEYFRTNGNPQQEWVNCLLSKRLSVWTFQIHHFLYLDGTKNYVFLV